MNLSASILCIVLALGLWSAASAAVAQDSFGSAPTPRTQTPPPVSQRTRPDQDLRAQPTPRPSGNEGQDMGVAPTRQLKAAPLHGPTPTAIPGGRAITTPDLVRLMKDPTAGALVFDVLGGPQTLPNAFYAAPAAQPGDFNDQVQRDFGNFLKQTTQGKLDRPMVFYCQNSQCWMSYNAALRAIAAGYRNVLWYRGGIEAWQQAGLPLAARGQGPAQR
jgi:rhodanese-related sulfurtransferase